MAGNILLLLLSVVVWQAAAGGNKQLIEFFKQQANNETFVSLYEEHQQHFRDDSKNLKAGATFSCQKLPTPLSVPTSVHKLTPMDVKVVAALGDSMTAGTGIMAKTVVGELIEDRGVSWSIGGDENIDTVDTLANILKVYNPKVTGFSTGCGPYWWEPTAHLNVANPGDKSKHMLGQAKLLVRRMKANSDIDYDNDWKVITIFIGGNDLCDFCTNKKKYGAESYRENLQEALDYLHANVPRTFVNLVEVLNIGIVKELNKNLICDIMHLFGCRCAAYPWNSKAEAELKAETQKYRDVMQELIDTGRYDTREDFTVISQPFFSNTYPPKKPGSEELDLSYFAPDCFHLSLKGHRAASDALWNNMVEPVGKKRTEWLKGEQLECPTTVQPYFYTYKNSQESLKANAELGGEQESEPENQFGFGAVQKETDTETQSDTPAGNQSATIATATVLTIAVVAGVALTLFGVVAWRRRKARKNYQNLLGRGEMN